MTNIIGTGSQAGVALGANFRLRLDPGSIARLRGKGNDAGGAVRRRYAGAMIDFYPDGGEGFHLSTGSRLDNRRKGHDLATSNSLLYAPKGFVGRRGGSFRKFASAMTVGYDSSPEPGMRFGVEAGALLEHGDPSSRELARFARQGSRTDGRFNAGQRFNPVVQASMSYKF